ncbi:MAG: AAA family ATPase [Oscillospiraceae bacterium]|nr:AAA family ATPase [Oscillospiraceae bacterium]
MNSNLLINSLTIDWSKISRESYLRKIPAISKLNYLEFSSPVTCFVGENGTGKSTLLEALAISAGFNPEGGTQNYRFSTYDSHSELYSAIKLVRGTRRPQCGYFLRAETYYALAVQEEYYNSQIGGKPEHLHERSHGEGFLTIAEKHFAPNGIYFLDEPESALSPQSQLGLLYSICECASAGSQFFIATHSPILLGIPNAELLGFDDGEIHKCRYEDTSQYQVMELFINHREQVLRHILDDEEAV